MNSHEKGHSLSIRPMIAGESSLEPSSITSSFAGQSVCCMIDRSVAPMNLAWLKEGTTTDTAARLALSASSVCSCNSVAIIS
jgi:hypothetical protein